MLKKNKMFQFDHIIHIYSIPSQSLLPSPLKPKDFTSQTKHLCVYTLARIGIKYRKEIHCFVFK